MSKKILIISDIHNCFENVESVFNSKVKYDLKISLGDFGSKKNFYYDKFDYKAKGNHDYYHSDSYLTNIIEVKGLKILITHGHNFDSLKERVSKKRVIKYLEKRNLKIDIFLFGHTHIPDNILFSEILFFNPGSISLPKKNHKPSYGEIIIENKKIVSSKILYLEK